MKPKNRFFYLAIHSLLILTLMAGCSALPGKPAGATPTIDFLATVEAQRLQTLAAASRATLPPASATPQAVNVKSTPLPSKTPPPPVATRPPRASGSGTTVPLASPGPTLPPNPRVARPDNALVVRMLYGSEKQAWIDYVTPFFNAQHNKTASGKVIYVETVPIGSLEAMEQIVTEADQPTIWSPASSLVVPLANQRWAETHAGSPALVGDSPSLVRSPVVIAMWRPMAEALGWPDKPLGWGDLADFITSGKTWADFGYPEWQNFKFGHTHPDYSNSGLTTMLALAYAGAGKSSGLTVNDLQNPKVAQFVSAVEKGVIHYGSSTGFFATQMFTKGPAYLSAAVLYESSVIDSYDRQRYPNLPFDVVAIYPKEGTYWSDHPFIIVNAPWVNDELRSAAGLYQKYLLDPAQQSLALRFGFRPTSESVSLDSSFSLSKGVDPAQPQAILEQPAADVIKAARNLWGANKKRVAVMVALDTSGSMGSADPPENLPRLPQAKKALKTFIGQLADEDSLGLVTFSTQKTVVQPITPLKDSRQNLNKHIDALFSSGNTRLIDTLYETYQDMAKLPPSDQIHAIVLLSDGADTNSQHTKDELYKLLQDNSAEGFNIKIFTIAYGSQGEIDHDLLKQVAQLSGGKYYESKPANIDTIYRDIATFF